MNPQVLLELVKKWEAQSVVPDCEDGSPDAAVANATVRARCSQLHECAEELKLLVKLLGR